MRDNARLQAVISVIEHWQSHPSPMDRQLAAYFRHNRYIGGKDKKVISEWVYTVFRHWAKATYLWQQNHETVTPRMRVLAALVWAKQHTLHDIDALCDGDKFAPQPLKEREREVLKHIAALQKDMTSVPQAVQWEVPAFLSHIISNTFGDDTARHMRAMQQEASVDVRVNTLKTNREALKDILEEEGVGSEETPMAPYGLRLQERVPFTALESFKAGLFEVQDEGSQLIALLCGAKPGQKVIDFCAGGGGKTLALAADMKNKGTVYAFDVNTYRMEDLGKRTRRADVHNVRRHVLQDAHDPWLKRLHNSADVVLVDAPCTGTGTWRRNPDAKWRLHEGELQEYTHLQASILESAARLVKEGGRLIYATCSILPIENAQQVQRFLEKNPAFEVLSVQTLLTEKGVANVPHSTPYLRLTPADHGCDGFFAAVLQKKKA